MVSLFSPDTDDVPTLNLADLGGSSHFAKQLDPDDIRPPVRVTAVQPDLYPGLTTVGEELGEEEKRRHER